MFITSPKFCLSGAWIIEPTLIVSVSGVISLAFASTRTSPSISSVPLKILPLPLAIWTLSISLAPPPVITPPATPPMTTFYARFNSSEESSSTNKPGKSSGT